MKIHPLTPEVLALMGITNLEHAMCVYEAEPGIDQWRGYMAAVAGWGNYGPLLCIPSLSYGEALQRLRMPDRQ